MGNKGYGEASRKVVRSYHEPVCSVYTDGKEAIPGIKIPAFKDAGQWLGEMGRHGRRHKVEEKLNTAKIAVIANINAKLPSGSVLRSLALFLVEKTSHWYVELHRHLDAELLRLTQMGLDKEALLILLSEEIIILFTLVHNVRKRGQEFSLDCDPKEYMVQSIWLTIECHNAMDEAIKNGIGSNGAISAAFVGFLTRQSAAAVAGKSDSKSDASKQKLETEVAKALTMAGDAKLAAKNAQSTADKAKEDLRLAWVKIKDLKN